MILLDAMDLQDGRIVHGEVDKRHGCKEGHPHGCRGGGSRTFVAGYVLAPLPVAPVNEADTVLFPEGLKALKRVAKLTGLGLEGA